MIYDLNTWKSGDPPCARCGMRLAVVWMHSPLGGHVALCAKHSRDLLAELRRHEKALRTLLQPVGAGS